MSFIRIKKTFNLFIKNSLRSFGLELKKISKDHHEINKVKNISKPKEKIETIKKLLKKYPDNPKIFLELLIYLMHLGDPSQFEVMMEYGDIRKKWLKNTGFDQLDIEFVHPDLVVGAFGSYYAIETLIRANELGLRKKRKLFLLMPKNAKFRNLTLSEYFKEYINFVNAEDLSQELYGLESFLTVPAGYCIPLKNECLHFDFVANRSEQEVQKRKLNYSTFNLKEEHYEKGVNFLKTCGLPKDSWYVTIHVREPGYRGETAKNSTQGYRNSNPLNYIKAIKRIINSGGWVFRMGDPSMTPMPKIKGLIDYAHSSLKSETMDVFLAATSKFCLGTSSGPIRVPRFFGVPVILSNLTSSLPYYSLKKNDLYLPRLIKKISNNENIKLEQTMSTPTSLYGDKPNTHQFAGLYWVENSADDIDLAVKEMLENLKLSFKNYVPTEEQLQFKKIAKKSSLDYANSLEAFASCSKYFLSNHKNLF